MAAGSVYLSLEPLRPDQYRQVAEWDYGPQSENTDWERYAADMSKPDWFHYGIYNGPDFVGAVSLEKISYNMAAYHVTTARRKIHPQRLATVLINLAGYLFSHGFTAVVARNPVEKRAGARLAIRCGMREWGRTPTTRYFVITRSRYIKNGWLKA